MRLNPREAALEFLRSEHKEEFAPGAPHFAHTWDPLLLSSGIEGTVFLAPSNTLPFCPSNTLPISPELPGCRLPHRPQEVYFSAWRCGGFGSSARGRGGTSPEPRNHILRLPCRARPPRHRQPRPLLCSSELASAPGCEPWCHSVIFLSSHFQCKKPLSLI